MSANQSNLSNAHYGYDFVVATTQESINATMKEYLYNSVFPTIKMYWNQDANGNPVTVSYEDLMVQTKGTDPLKVANWKSGDPMNQDITNINQSQFYFAFEAAIGIPANLLQPNIPDIITLQSASQSVIFNLICAQFTVVTCNFGRQGLTSFQSFTQPTDAPWLFTSIVALKNIINNTNLPPNVQAQLNNFGQSAFSVQQLIFDLDNAALESTPTISGIEPGTPVYTLLSQVFLGAYFNEMKTKGAPILNYSIVQNSQIPNPSTLTLTNIALEVSPYIDPVTKSKDNNNLNTLNYLCAINGNALPPSVPFSWNWVEQSEISSFNGVISIKRLNFLNYLSSLLSANLGALNIITNVSMTHSGENMYSSWGYSGGGGAGQGFTLLPVGQMPVDGFTSILSYSKVNNSSDDTHDALHIQKMNGDFNYNVNVIVSIKDNIIKVTVHAVSYIHFWYGGYYGGTIAKWEGNVVDYTTTVLYTMGIQQDGSLKVDEEVLPFQDNSQKLNTSGWDKLILGNMVDTTNEIKNSLKPVVQSSMTKFNDSIEKCLDGYRNFVFPGGKTFTFKDVVFSDNQDLISHISYVQPS